MIDNDNSSDNMRARYCCITSVFLTDEQAQLRCVLEHSQLIEVVVKAFPKMASVHHQYCTEPKSFHK